MRNISLVFFLIALTIYGLVIRDYQTESQQQQATIEQLERDIEIVQAERTALETQEAELGVALERSFDRIPGDNEQENILRDLQRISQSSGFAFNGLSFGKGFNAEVDTNQIMISFSVQGPYAQLFPFLRLIEQNNRFLGMNDLRLSITDNPTLGRTVSTDITLYALYQ